MRSFIVRNDARWPRVYCTRGRSDRMLNRVWWRRTLKLEAKWRENHNA